MLHCKSFSNCQGLFRTSFFGFFFLIFNLLFVNPLSAQKKGGNFGVGFQVGKTIGLNFHFRGVKPFRFDILIGGELPSTNTNIIIDMHGHWFIPFKSNQSFNFYLGPGAFIGLRDNDGGSKDDFAVDLVGGVNGNFGINYEFNRFDIFL